MPSLTYPHDNTPGLSIAALTALAWNQSPMARIRCGVPKLPKATQIYRKTGNLRAVQLFPGHTKLESTVRYLGIEVNLALKIAEQIEL
jgi:hypothetical protein